MKNIKNSNLLKLVAFFILTAVLSCTVAYAAQDWQTPSDTESDDNGKTEDDNKPSGDTDENTDENVEKDPTVQLTPDFFHYLTGLEVSPDARFIKPLCFTLSTERPIYGLSESYLVVEMPCEGEKTRFLAFFDNAYSLGKLGSIDCTRGYISNVVGYFGGISIYNGNDSMLNYDSITPPDGEINLKENLGYHYTEYTSYVYTNGDLLSALIRNTKTSTVRTEIFEVPYVFADYFTPIIPNGDNCVSITIPYANGNTTELIYSDAEKQYTLLKNGTVVNDLLIDKACKYDNVFILFADSTTYETSEYTECVLNTATSGVGKYSTMGKCIDITWSVEQNGSLTFFDADGNKLTVNRGKSFISYAKSSSISNVKIK